MTETPKHLTSQDSRLTSAPACSLVASQCERC